MPWTINPSHEEIAILMEAAILSRDMKRFAEAREILKGVRSLVPHSEVPEVALGTVAFHEGDFESAAKHYRRALELNPRSAWATVHMGEVSLFQANRLEARRYLKAAINLDPRGEHGKLARALMEMFADFVNS